MKDFIQPREDKVPVDHDLMDRFIDIMNQAISKNEFYINTGLDHAPELNDDEFELVKIKANSNGYVLSRYEDNYNTTTYKLEKK